MVKASKAKSVIGFVYGGFYKLGMVHIFKNSDSFEKAYDELKVKFGDDVVGRYTTTSDIDVNFDKICKQCEDSRVGEHVFKLNVTPMANIIKTVTGVKQLSHFGPEKDDEKDTKDTKKKSKKDDSDESDDEKPSKKDDSDDESEEEDEKKKPVAKKGATKKEPAKKDNNDSDEESDEEVDDKKKPNKKSPPKKESSKKPSKKHESDEEDSDDE